MKQEKSFIHKITDRGGLRGLHKPLSRDLGLGSFGCLLVVKLNEGFISDIREFKLFVTYS